MFKLLRDRKGAALLEYALVTAGIALVAAGAVAIFGHKTSDMMAVSAAILPGAHADDNGNIVSGKLIETGANADGNLSIDVAGIQANNDTQRLGNNLFGAGGGALVGGDEVGGTDGLVVEAE